MAVDVWLRDRSLATRGAAPGAQVVAPEQSTLPQPGDQFARAVELARDGDAFVADEERIVATIAATLGWSRTRARWFIAVNREQLTA